MPQMRIRDAAAHVGVSDDTLRRWVHRGTLHATLDSAGRQVVDGYEVALAARRHTSPPPLPPGTPPSTATRLVGLVTDIQDGPIMTRVEVQCGPFQIDSLMSTETVSQLGLELGSVAVAEFASTNVIIETPPTRRRRMPSDESRPHHP